MDLSTTKRYSGSRDSVRSLFYNYHHGSKVSTFMGHFVVGNLNVNSSPLPENCIGGFSML